MSDRGEERAGPARTREKRTPKRNFVALGAIKIRWYRLGDGRTCLDLRRYRKADQRPTFVDHAEAMAEANRIAMELNAGGVESQEALTSQDRAVFAMATDKAQRMGVDLATAIAEWYEARQCIAGIGKTLREAAAAGADLLRTKLHPTGDVVLEILASKRGHDLYARYFNGLKRTFQHFSAAFPGPIEHVTAAQIEAYVRALDVGPRRQNNVLSEIRQLFQFAKTRGYLPDRITEAKKVPALRRVQSKIGVLSPEVMAIYLRHVDEHFLPWMAIAAFSGLRAEEIVLTKGAARRKDPLRWEDFDWDSREIVVRQETAKTGHSRRTPIADNLYAWLTPWRDAKAKGPVCPRVTGKLVRTDDERERVIREAKRALAKEIGRDPVDLSYPHNGFRHSYGSYRMAILKNENQVAYEMGNSVGMIRKNYHNPRPLTEAQAWFSIFPQQAGNVLQLTFAAVP